MAREQALRVTGRWLQGAVAGGLFSRTLCPFAAAPLRSGAVRLALSDATCPELLLGSVRRELATLFPLSSTSTSASAPECPVPTLNSTDSDTVAPRPETTLLVAPHLFQNDFRGMIHFSWRIMDLISSDSDLAGRVQVVNFHPEAVHSLYATGAMEDGSEYSIRSPLPTFHFLREEDILAAVGDARYPEPELIPERNAAALRKLGPDECRRRLASLHDGAA